MLLNPPLNDGGRLSQTRAGFLRVIYFGGKDMPPFGMGAHNGKIAASPEGYVARHGSRRLMPKEALDIASYLHFCYQSPKPVRWKEMDGKVQLDLSDFE